jgi:hypothetical protein
MILTLGEYNFLWILQVGGLKGEKIYSLKVGNITGRRAQNNSLIKQMNYVKIIIYYIIISVII